KILADPHMQPRVDGLDLEHVRALEAVAEAWPPLKVVRQDDRYLLVDGFHRFAAAQNLGLETVPVLVLDPPEDGDLHGLAFSLNAAHGRPLNLSDRRAFAARLLQAHGSARGKMMHGGFSLKLTDKRYRPAVQVKHLSRRASMIRFTVPGKQRTPRGMRKRGIIVQPHRGFFVDIKTLAAALTSRSFSLANLGEFLGVQSEKLATEEHGGQLTEAYLAYAERDVQTTWV
ncbi:MAG TPA: ParB/RepB/Spo0J family partition protein, partial [Rhodocyclaceae bacterium]|nr:ParB/RepB/Spo0J family partition protein [Rhodocyclaceae bacterium]